MKYRVTFERIAEHEDIPPLVLRAKTEEALSAGIWAYVRRFMDDAEFGVFLDTEKMAGVIDDGENGSFTVREVGRAAAPGTVGEAVTATGWLDRIGRSRGA